MVPAIDYCHIVDVMKRYKKAYFEYCDTKQISQIIKARESVPFKTMGMELVNCDVDEIPIPHTHCCEMFGAMAFEKNNHLRCHVDDDFCHLIMTVHFNGKKYEHDDTIVVYFCFPTLGLAVPLRPGDARIFNPREEHMLSLRCENKTEVYTISFYLKTVVFGLNDNHLNLTLRLEMLLKDLGE